MTKWFTFLSTQYSAKFISVGIILVSLVGCSQSIHPVPIAEERVESPGITAHDVRQTAPSKMEFLPISRCCVIGRSVQGRDIYLYLFVHTESFEDSMNLKPNVEKVLILGGTHGNEPTGATTAHRLVAELQKNPHLYVNRYVAVVPEVNPDGLAANSRVNANGVDLNRNLPAANWRLTKRDNAFGGLSPNSEPETQALTKLIERFKPDRILTLHSIAEGRHGNNYDGPAEQLARRLCEKNGYPLLKTMGYPTPGSLGTWAGIERQIPIVTLEFARCRSTEQCWTENAQALIEFIQNTDVETCRSEGEKTCSQPSEDTRNKFGR